MKKTSVNKKTIIFFLIIILLFITISIILVLQNKSKVDFSAYISEGNIFVFDPINNKNIQITQDGISADAEGIKYDRVSPR